MSLELKREACVGGNELLNPPVVFEVMGLGQFLSLAPNPLSNTHFQMLELGLCKPHFRFASCLLLRLCPEREAAELERERGVSPLQPRFFTPAAAADSSSSCWVQRAVFLTLAETTSSYTH